MRLVRNNPDARWLPSRFRYPLGRLIAALVLASRRKSQETKGLVLAVERDQNPFESNAIAAGVSLTLIIYFAEILRPYARSFSYLLAVITTVVALHAAILFFWWFFRMVRVRNAQFITDVLFFLVLVALSMYYVLTPSTSPLTRIVAVLLVGAVVLNILASVVLRLFRTTIARLEERVTQ